MSKILSFPASLLKYIIKLFRFKAYRLVFGEDKSRRAIHLQIKAEKSQHGHINFWTEIRMKEFSENAGFYEVQTCDRDIYGHGFDLSIERK